MTATMLSDAHFWIAAALAVFFGVLWWAKVPGVATRALDAAGHKVRAQLDEAARLRAEAQALLDSIKARRAETEAAAEQMLAEAQQDAERTRVTAQADLEEEIRRRGVLAERRIAAAEAQATADVRTAAVDQAAAIAERILAARIAGATNDPSIDAALSGLEGRFRA